MRKIKRAQGGANVTGATSSRKRTVMRNPENTYKMVSKEKVTPRGEKKSFKETRTIKGVMKGVPKRSGVIDRMRGTFLPNAEFDIPQVSTPPRAKGGKQMIKRADGSYSQRGLWDNIRAAAKRNKAAGRPGKKPTAAMLKQERKIKAKSKK